MHGETMTAFTLCAVVPPTPKKACAFVFGFLSGIRACPRPPENVLYLTRCAAAPPPYQPMQDVMEPICFIVGGGQTMVGYTYFMATRREFSWEGALERHVGRWEAERLQRAGFDMQRYARLKREVARLSELLAVQEQDAAAAAAAAAAATEKEE